jgi:hypothetical protein
MFQAPRLAAGLLTATLAISTTLAAASPAFAGPAPNQNGGGSPSGGAYTPAGATAVPANFSGPTLTDLPPTYVRYPNPSAFSNQVCSLDTLGFPPNDVFDILNSSGFPVGQIACTDGNWYGQLQA